MRVPRSRIKYEESIKDAIDDEGEWKLYRKMSESVALQTARRFNEPVGGAGFVFGVGDDGNLYIKYEGEEGVV